MPQFALIAWAKRGQARFPMRAVKQYDRDVPQKAAAEALISQRGSSATYKLFPVRLAGSIKALMKVAWIAERLHGVMWAMTTRCSINGGGLNFYCASKR
jgi:hypothetical protein